MDTTSKTNRFKMPLLVICGQTALKEIRRKKEVAEAKKVAVIEKRRIEAEAVLERKRKREEVKVAKELKKLSKPKRVYRLSLQISSIPIDPALKMEESEDQSLIPSMAGYNYP